MGYYPDLREYLKELERCGWLYEISRPINKDTELMPLVRWQYRGLPEHQRKAFLFTNVTDGSNRSYEGRVGVSLLGSTRSMYALGLKCTEDQIFQRWKEGSDHPLPPETVAGGPVKEVIHTAAEIKKPGEGLDRLPVPISTPGFDPAPFFSSAYLITKDIETGVQNVGTYRIMLKSNDRVSVLCHPTQHIGIHWRKAQMQGRPLEAALVLGAVPVVGMVSVAKVPYGVDEMAVAGGLVGEPLSVISCETVDLKVPATAEIVIEGLINTDILEPEGPFGEYTGFMGRRSMSPFMEVTCITHRRNPILQTYISQLPPSEASKLRAVSWEAAIYNHLKSKVGIEKLKTVALNEYCEHDYIVLVMDEPGGKVAWEALNAVAAMEPTTSKIVVAVDSDIDPRNADALNWAFCNQVQPHRDTKVVSINRRKESVLDPSITPPGTPGRFNPAEPEAPSAILLNAVRKHEYPPIALPAAEYMERARQIWEEEGLPLLRPVPPLHSCDLDMWDSECAEEARLAVEGNHQETVMKRLNNQFIAVNTRI